MNIYTHDDYRTVLREAVRQRREVDPSFTFSRLARKMGVQKPYLSKVLKGTAELSHDQLYLAGEALGFGHDEMRYLELLLELSRSSLKKRKEKLLAHIRKLQAERLESKNFLSNRVVTPGTKGISEYYLSPLNQLVHVALSLPRYQKDPSSLAHDLRASPEAINKAIGNLERMGLIAREKDRITLLVRNIHLPVDSPLYPAWRQQLRLMGLARLQGAPPSEDLYSFSMLFSADPATNRRIRSKFLELLKEADRLIKEAPYEEVFQMNFDLIPWSFG